MDMKIDGFIKEIKNNHKGRLYIQPHDYPDYDALGSAYALKEFLKIYEINSEIIYAGYLSNFIIDEFVKKIGINPIRLKDVENNSIPVISVDTIPTNNNITLIKNEYIGFIDHHINNEKKANFYFEDFRKAGAVSSIITEYYKNKKENISECIANALAIGLLTDTNSLSRGVSKKDLLNYYYLFTRMDHDYVNYIVRNKIAIDDLNLYVRAINSLNIFKNIGLVVLNEVENRNILGIVGDFFLSINEISVNILVNRTSKGSYISVRSEEPNMKANNVVDHIIKDKGDGGGHFYMAGGFTEMVLEEKYLFNIINKELLQK